MKNTIKNIGVIGIGMLGKAVCIQLLKAGFKITVFNRTKKKANDLIKLGINVVNTPSDVAQKVDLIFTVVKDANALYNVSFKEHGIIKKHNKNLVVADMSTINPITSIKIAKKFSENKITFLSIPVMGGPNAVLNGELIMIASGNKKIFNNYKKVFTHIAKKIFYFKKYSTAYLIKLAMNIQIAFLAVSISEGIILVNSANINPKFFLKVLNATYFKTGMSEKKAYKMLNNSFKPTFKLKNLKKDLETIKETTDKLNIKLPITNNIKNIYKKATNDGFGELDYTEILRYLNKYNFKRS